MVVLWIYVACTVLIALRLAWHMRFKLDRFDWQYGSVWSSLWLSLLLWPVLLLKPRCFIDFLRNPELSSGVMDINPAARERELNRLRTCPPPCGSFVRYRQPNVDEVAPSIVLPAEALEAALSGSEPGTEHADILRWVESRDPKCDSVVDVPVVWGEFSVVASGLLNEGKGRAVCGHCGSSAAASDLKYEVFSVVGHSFDVWSCTCGQVVLRVDRGHVHSA